MNGYGEIYASIPGIFGRSLVPIISIQVFAMKKRNLGTKFGGT